MLSEHGRKQLRHLMVDAGVSSDGEIVALTGLSHSTVNNFRLGKTSSVDTTVAIFGALLERQKVAVSTEAI